MESEKVQDHLHANSRLQLIIILMLIMRDYGVKKFSWDTIVPELAYLDFLTRADVLEIFLRLSLEKQERIEDWRSNMTMRELIHTLWPSKRDWWR